MIKSHKLKFFTATLYLTIIGSLLLPACSSSAITQPSAVTLTPTPPAATETFIPASATPTIEATQAPTVIPPTSTPLPIILEQIAAEAVGVGENGSMLCISSYGGDASLPGELNLTAAIRRDGMLVESGIPAQQVEGREYPCFEMVDAKYVQVSQDGILSSIPGTLLAEIRTSSPDGRAVTNSTQIQELGTYLQPPFLPWVFPNGLAWRGTFTLDHRAHDLVPQPNAENPALV